MNIVLVFILFVLMMGAIVSIHEFGHFIACRFFNVYVSEFSIGMGKQIFSKKGKETTFSIRLLPIGGFCAIAGDNENELETTVDTEKENIPFERTLLGVAKWKKIIILLSGVLMNCILALVIVAFVYLGVGQTVVSPKPVVAEVMINSPAERAGLIKDDLVIKAEYDNGYSISPDTFQEISDFLLLYEKGDISLTIKRGRETIEIKVTPEYSEEKQGNYIGITSYENSVEKVTILNCFKHSYLYLVTMFKLIWTTLLGLFRGVGLNNLSGPIGIYQATSQAVSYGVESYLLLIAMISFNVGIFNLLPIPVLDGGRIVLTIVEAIVGKPIPKKVEEIIMTVSIVLFIALLIFATGQDIFRIFR